MFKNVRLIPIRITPTTRPHTKRAAERSVESLEPHGKIPWAASEYKVARRHMIFR